VPHHFIIVIESWKSLKILFIQVSNMVFITSETHLTIIYISLVAIVIGVGWIIGISIYRYFKLRNCPKATSVIQQEKKPSLWHGLIHKYDELQEDRKKANEIKLAELKTKADDMAAMREQINRLQQEVADLETEKQKHTASKKKGSIQTSGKISKKIDSLEKQIAHLDKTISLSTKANYILADNTPKLKYCPGCGKKIVKNSNFCKECGYDLIKPEKEEDDKNSKVTSVNCILQEQKVSGVSEKQISLAQDLTEQETNVLIPTNLMLMPSEKVLARHENYYVTNMRLIREKEPFLFFGNSSIEDWHYRHIKGMQQLKYAPYAKFAFFIACILMIVGLILNEVTTVFITLAAVIFLTGLLYKKQKLIVLHMNGDPISILNIDRPSGQRVSNILKTQLYGGVR
jgi:hypothetical protein